MPPTDSLFFAAVAFAGLALATLVYYGAAIWHVRRIRRELPTARAGLALADAARGEQSVCVVVPGHNEEAVIADLIRSLRAQTVTKLRVVLALDRCTDRTVPLAREEIDGDARFTIVEVSECPAGWAGKVNAVWQGVRRGGAMDADLLLFADADTRFHPRCIEAAAALLRERRLDMLSLVSTCTSDTWFERVAQPAAGVELLRQYPLTAANRDSHRRPFANGQFMLFTRSAYERCGGHEAVKSDLLEDLRFARVLHYYGLKPGVLLADGMLHCRMYHTWEEFRRGWKRIFTEAGNRRARRLARKGWLLRLTGSVMPAGGVAAVGLGAWGWSQTGAWADAGVAAIGLAGLAAYAGFWAMVQRLNHARVLDVLAAPVGAWLVGGIMIEAARDLRRGVRTQWGGISYQREVREADAGPI